MMYRIKPLAWEAEGEDYSLTCGHGGYAVFLKSGAWRVSNKAGSYPTFEAAKAAAEADWQARIEEALEPVPSGWINVKDRLPEDMKHVLVFGVLKGKVLPGVHKAWHFRLTGHWVEDDDREWPIYNVTHWQPMPVPPVEANHV